MSYTGWLLPEPDRAKLLQLFPPVYHDVIAHHITIAMGVKELPTETTAMVVGITDDGVGCQALIVSINGSTMRQDGYTYHITWSIDRDTYDRKPFHSMNVLQTIEGQPVDPPIPIELVPMVFKD